MFTGIIQSVGLFQDLDRGRLKIHAPLTFSEEGFELGESISVSGCCLTVVESFKDATGWMLDFDLSPETLGKTSLGSLSNGSLVNLERAMQASSRFGGHIVQGHVDSTGTISDISPAEGAVILSVVAPREYSRYLIDKGSVTVDGISLTVVDPTEDGFTVWIIPHTLEHTNLRDKAAGSMVNLEFDMVAKYLEKLAKPYSQAAMA